MTTIRGAGQISLFPKTVEEGPSSWCGHSNLVEECYGCFKARMVAWEEELRELERAAEADCPTTARPGTCATRGDHPRGWCSTHNRRRATCNKIIVDTGTTIPVER